MGSLMGSRARSTALSGPRGDYPGLRETGDLGGGEAGFTQHLGVVLPHARRLPAYAGTLTVGAEFDGQSRQAGDFAVTAAKARNEHVHQTAGGQKVWIGEQIAWLTDRRPSHVAP